MREHSASLKKILLARFVGAAILLFILTVLSGSWLVRFSVFGISLAVLAYGHKVTFDRLQQTVRLQITATQEQLEENFSHELQSYTNKLEEETQKLQDTMDFVSSILDSSTEYSIITTGKDGKITLFNKGAERMIGYSAEDVVHKESPLLFLRSPSNKSFAQVGLQIMKHGVDEGEWEVIRKDGQSLTVIFTMTPMRNREGKMLGFLGIAKDVTEQKRLERQLKDYTENLEKIVEVRTHELATKNQELDVQRQTAENRAQELDLINKLSQAISSTIELEEVLAIGAKRSAELLHVTQARLFLLNDDAKQLQSLYKYDQLAKRGDFNSNVSAPLSRYPDFMEAIRTGQAVSVNNVQQSSMAPEVKRVFEKQGIHAILNIPMMSKDTAIGIMMLLHTGTPRTFNEEEVNLAETVASQLAVALKNAQLFRHVVEEKGRIEALLNSSNDGILMTDNRFHLLLTNAVVDQFFQIDATRYHSKHLVEFIDAQKDNLKEFDLVKQIIYQIITSPEGRVTEEISLVSPPKTLKVTGNPVLGEKKKVIGHMIALHDITQEKQLEQMRDDLISMIVHDLKNPLAGVIGFTEIMLERAKKRNIEDFVRFLTGISEQANTLHEMVNNILEVHKMEDGSMEIQKDVAELPAIVEEAIRQVDVSAKQRQVAIFTELPPELPPVFVDQTKIVRLFANILSNGVKYTPPEGKITVQITLQDSMILTGISDNGKGIPAEYLGTIFDRFAQVDRKRQGKAASVGLGLYFCKLVVEAHGGKIWAESEEGRGSTFYFTIPNVLQEDHDEDDVMTI